MYEQARNFNQILLEAMDAHADQACFQVRWGRLYQPVSYRRFRTLTFRLTNFFRQQGITRVAIIADNCLEWMVAYLSCLLAGGAVVPLRTSLAPEMLQSILRDSGAHLVVLNDPVHLETLLKGTKPDTEDGLPDLKSILVIDGGEVSEEPLPNVIPIKSLLSANATPSPEELKSLQAFAKSIGPQTMATISYGFTQTDRPKGAVFGHAQRLATMRHMAEWLTFNQDDTAFTPGPWSEAPSLMATLHYFLSGIANTIVEKDASVGDSMEQTSPTIMLATPHSFKRIYDEVMANVARLH